MKKENNKEIKNKDKEEKQLRQIIIETDGKDIKVVKNESAGRIELMGIFQSLLTFLSNQK
jgi:hypothetical protein